MTYRPYILYIGIIYHFIEIFFLSLSHLSIYLDTLFFVLQFIISNQISFFFRKEIFQLLQ